MNKLILLCLVVAALGLQTSCKSGNPNQRNDIIAQMQTIKQPLDDCYQIALARNRKTAGGFITVEFIAEAGTGQFKNVIVRRDEVQDPAVRMCVIQNVGKLKLPKPPDSNAQIPYAFQFVPQQ